MPVAFSRLRLSRGADPAPRASRSAVFRSALTHEPSAVLLRLFVANQLFTRLTGLVDGPQAQLRANLAASHLIGVAVLRYILRVEPIASASTDELVAWLAPALDHYLSPERADSEEIREPEAETRT